MSSTETDRVSLFPRGVVSAVLQRGFFFFFFFLSALLLSHFTIACLFACSEARAEASAQQGPETVSSSSSGHASLLQPSRPRTPQVVESRKRMPYSEQAMSRMYEPVSLVSSVSFVFSNDVSDVCRNESEAAIRRVRVCCFMCFQFSFPLPSLCSLLSSFVLF